jgi:hypothetical protein
MTGRLRGIFSYPVHPEPREESAFAGAASFGF